MDIDIEKAPSQLKGKHKLHDFNANSQIFSSNNSKASKSLNNPTRPYECWSPTDGPRQVWVNINIGQLDRIDTINQTFGAKFTVIQSWLWSEDDEKQHKGRIHEEVGETINRKLNANRISDVKPSWEPKSLNFDNAVTFDNKEKCEAVLRRYNQLVLWEKTTHVWGVFSERFELQSFPFDCQNFHIKITWQDYDSACKVYPNPIQRTFVSLNLDSMVQREYKIHEPIAESYLKPIKVVQSDLSIREDHQCVIQINLKGERYWMPYFWKTISMMAFMSAFSLFVFTLKLDESGERLTAITTLFLALVVQFALNNDLPKLCHSTFLDKYVRAGKIFTGLIMLQESVISWLMTHTNIQVSNEVDDILLILNTIILLIGNATFAFHCYRFILPREKSKLIHLYTNDCGENNLIHKSLQYCMTSLHRNKEANEYQIESWMAISVDRERKPSILSPTQHFVYCGRAATDRIIFDLFHERHSRCQVLDQSLLSDHLRSYLHGTWDIRIAENRHKILSAWMLIKYWEHNISEFNQKHTRKAAEPTLLFTKITGDPKLPAGKVSMRGSGILLPGNNESIDGEVLIRRDVDNFDWVPVKITRPNATSIITKLATEEKFLEATKEVEIELTHCNIEN